MSKNEVKGKLKKALGIPENIKVVAITPLGYPADKEGLGSKLRKTAIEAENENLSQR